MENWFMSKDQGIYNGEKAVSSINDDGKPGQPHAKRINLYLYLKPHWKFAQNGLTLMYVLKP